MIVLVTGGRDYRDKRRVYSTLSAIHRVRPITFLAQGGASGADTYAKQWADDMGIPGKTWEADWDRHDNHAGRVRNCKMLREARPLLVVAFPGGKGTRHMVSISNIAGVKVWQIK